MRATMSIFKQVTLGATAGVAILAGCARGPGAQGPEALVAEGWERFGLGEFAPAANAFEAAARSAPAGSEARLRARYGLAVTWHLRRPGQDYAKAGALYRGLAAEAPQHELAAWCLLGLARMAYAVQADQTPDYAAVAALYRDVIARYPEHPAAREAFLLWQAMRLETAAEPEIRDVLAALEGFQAAYTAPPYQSAAWSLRGYAHGLLREAAAAIRAGEAAIRAEEDDPSGATVDQSYAHWQIACMAEFEVGDFELARAYYRKYIQEYPTDQRVFLAKQELRRMDELEAGFRAERKGVAHAP
jgi:tetratricopeptide (TPR) repeat protein